MFHTLVTIAALMWLGLLLAPWRPWQTRERLTANPALLLPLGEISVVIPARNEAECIADTLRDVAAQGTLARIVLVDDQSEDGTGDIARGLGLPNLLVIGGSTPPPGWSGKLWALSQGFAHVESQYTLLLDADISVRPGLVPALLEKLTRESRDMVSIMATLYMASFWERLLLPPFIYFFKLIYPFALTNSDRSRLAAAAGGCILLRTERLRGIGGFAALRDALIDDCTLARCVKRAGGRIWIGLSRDVRAIRPYHSVQNIWNMVARTAYTQLRYSFALLVLCTVLLLISFVVPVIGAFTDFQGSRVTAMIALAAMFTSYAPTLRYYERPLTWAPTLPVAASLYLAMTWTSALRYLRGERSRWKNRVYERDETPSA
ncbi:MAG: glycosyltransferase [Gammaproteobacteria bacterium]|nr:glycosyltransferase [Gammaproteobacteria bacterium]MBI5615361.1 glycosyltransferase [Gammaproteobacteria bacterium]